MSFIANKIIITVITVLAITAVIIFSGGDNNDDNNKNLTSVEQKNIGSGNLIETLENIKIIEPTSSETKSTPSNIQPLSLILCNGKYYGNCPTGKSFYCPPTGKAQCISESAQQSQSIETRQIKTFSQIFYPVVKVVDGDTFSINIDGVIQTVRLIGLDTSETVHPSKPVECFGQEASNKAKRVLGGQSVRLEQDPTQGTYDKYGRLLAYVYLNDGTFFNKTMIEEGYGFEYTYVIPYKYQSEFQLAENQARILKKGLWAEGRCDVAETSPATETQIAPSPTFPQSINYQCSYNAYNCPDFSVQAEAQAVYEYCGGINNDIHRLDKDKDGIACESLP
jgi:micrococcal nuclease